MNFSIDPKSDHLMKSIELVLTKSIDRMIFLQVYVLYKARLAIYKADLTRYDQQKEVFHSLIQFIQSTISTSAAVAYSKEGKRKKSLDTYD